MPLAVALLYLAAVAGCVYGWLRTVAGKPTYGAGYFAAACAILAFSLPAVAAGL